MIVGPEIWDVEDRLLVTTPADAYNPKTRSWRWNGPMIVRYNRFVKTVTILNQLFAKTKMETA